MSFRFRKDQPSEPEAATTTVVTLPRKHRRRDAELRVAERQRRSQKQAELESGRPHGWARAEDPELHVRKPSFLERRRADGTPLLLFTVLAVLTGVGLARVDSRIEVLDVANEITNLSEEQQALLDRKRRLETERAYLRRPARIAAQASERLGMIPAPPERIQKIEVRPANPLASVASEASPRGENQP